LTQVVEGHLHGPVGAHAHILAHHQASRGVFGVLQQLAHLAGFWGRHLLQERVRLRLVQFVDDLRGVVGRDELQQARGFLQRDMLKYFVDQRRLQVFEDFGGDGFVHLQQRVRLLGGAVHQREGFRQVLGRVLVQQALQRAVRLLQRVAQLRQQGFRAGLHRFPL